MTDANFPSIYKSRQGYEAILAWYDEAMRELPVETEDGWVQTRFGRTHYLAAGPEDAPPLILVQGYGASAPLWHRQLADFSAHFRVIALDTNGQPGKSDPTPPPFAGDGHALWLGDVLDALALDSALVGGACVGGWAALRLAITAPQRIRKLVLLSPVGLAPFKIYWRSGVPFILNLGNDPQAAGQRLLVNAFTPPGSNLNFDRQLARALTLSIRHYRIGRAVGYSGDSPTAREFVRSLGVLRTFVRGIPDAELRQVAVPTLVLIGEYEAIYDPRRALAKARRAIPNVDADIVPGTGHAAIYDRPDIVNPRVIEFLHQ